MPTPKKNQNAFSTKKPLRPGDKRKPKLTKTPDERLQGLNPEQVKRIMEQRKKIKGFGK